MADKSTSQHPLQPSPEGADRGFVRFDSSTITVSELRPLKPQGREITDRGIVRFGSGMITSER
ncbi:MAG: hypothetical protein JO139_02735 [Alphaproteobacteria bacterium]|nr:hypothetical protein [Alphaproteobacteria bacterium]MBV8335790.1 hypothetical protein [Alphaproteobacteria bacterium]